MVELACFAGKMDGSEEDIGDYSSDRVNPDEKKQLEVEKNVGMTYP